jgi:electron transport complex protein RnfC
VASPILNAFLPATALVPLKQHSGPQARCVVKPGDFVREGALLGKAEKAGSANIHSPIPGVVREVKRLRTVAGVAVEAVEIALEGRFDRLGKREERYVWTSMTRNDIIQTLRDKGIVSMDNEARPLIDLIQGPAFSSLVLNGMESEPFLRTEASLLGAKTWEVLEGLAIIAKLLSPLASYVCIDDGEEDLRSQLLPLAATTKLQPQVIVLEARYPQDLPRQLLSVIYRDRKPLSTKDSLILTPSTAFAVYEAVVLARPLVERFVTIAGGAIKHPAVLKARIGTSIGDLIEECGGFLDQPSKLILGGPLRGYPVYDLDAPVTKSTQAVLALSLEETGRSRVEACIRCGRCRDVCPERLDPEALQRNLGAGRGAEAETLGLGDCTLCGACAYICPSQLPLVEIFDTGRRTQGELQ